MGPASATWPSYMVDATPVRNWVFQWLAFLDRIEAELYYQIDYCWIYAACGGESNASAPWNSVYAFGGNGDGTLIYPGTPARIGGTTPIAVPSIRLKQIRDGMQDFEYLNALSKAGQDKFARSVAAPRYAACAAKRMTRQGSPACAAGAWGARTISASARARVLTSEESCEVAGRARKAPSLSRARIARI